MSTLAEKIAVMQAAERGERIGWRPQKYQQDSMVEAISPVWDWVTFEYCVLPPATRKVKMLAYFTGMSLHWFEDSWAVNNIDYKRAPSEDKLIEVEC